MTISFNPDYEAVPDDFIRAILFSFAMADYDGEDAVRLSAFCCSDVLGGLDVDLVNEALSSAREVGLIDTLYERPGAIRMTPLGKKKFLLIRDDFFDDHAVADLRRRLAGLDLHALRSSGFYRQHQQNCTALAVSPTQSCPQAGRWLARRLEERQCVLQEGDIVPLPELDTLDRPVLWYLMKS